ncbi:hypothetical protein F5878DRAFT_668906 [Lentinula raphanica]|uniref:Uncharacterized protein n=1 Tax=Lentinula raphanica TaxID=153919 RepID=A0AA38NXJ7_9AGAR|nr:hypothetical protein F5878DRAFT_668906 [Lentinula raphanica]
MSHREYEYSGIRRARANRDFFMKLLNSRYAHHPRGAASSTSQTTQTPTSAEEDTEPITSVVSGTLVTLTRSVQASSTASSSATSDSGKTAGITVVIVIASCVGGITILWTIFRKWKLGCSSKFDQRLQPPNKDTGIPTHRRCASDTSSFHLGCLAVDVTVHANDSGDVLATTSNSTHTIFPPTRPCPPPLPQPSTHSLSNLNNVSPTKSTTPSNKDPTRTLRRTPTTTLGRGGGQKHVHSQNDFTNMSRFPQSRIYAHTHLPIYLICYHLTVYFVGWCTSSGFGNTISLLGPM